MEETPTTVDEATQIFEQLFTHRHLSPYETELAWKIIRKSCAWDPKNSSIQTKSVKVRLDDASRLDEILRDKLPRKELRKNLWPGATPWWVGDFADDHNTASYMGTDGEYFFSFTIEGHSLDDIKELVAAMLGPCATEEDFHNMVTGMIPVLHRLCRLIERPQPQEE